METFFFDKFGNLQIPEINNMNKIRWHKAEKHFHSRLEGVNSQADFLSDMLLATFLDNRNKLKERLYSFSIKALQYLDEKEKKERLSFLKEDISVYDSRGPLYKRASFRLDEPTPEETFKTVVQGLVTGDQDVFINLYEYELPKVVSFVLKNNGTVEYAEDIFQEALVIIVEKVYAKKLDLNCSFETYLYSICKNLWMEELRKNKRRISFVKFSFENNELTTTIKTEQLPDYFEELMNVFNDLDEKSKTLLRSYYYENLSWKQIAKNLNYSSAASARNQKYKCLERIRKYFDKQ